MSNRTALFSRHQPGGVFTIENLPEHPADIWFVDSGASGAGDTVGHGQNPDSPFATVAYAFSSDLVAAGDVVYVMPGHAEAPTALGTFDIAGVKVVGLGEGNKRPAITFTHAVDGWSLTADDIVIENIRFVTPADTVTAVLNIAAARCKVRGCRFELGANVVDAVTITAAGEEPTFEDNEVVVTADGPDCWLKFEGVVDKPVIRRNIVIGSDGTNAFDDGVLDFNNVAVTNALIYENVFGDGNAAVTVFANGGNVVGETIGINYYAALATNADTVGFPLADNAITAAKIAADAIAAAEIANGAIDAASFAADALQAMQDEAEDALEGENLDHLAAVTTAAADMTAEVVDGSVISRMLSKISDTSSYDPTTDAQEMLSDKLGAFSGDGGAAQDDSVKASLDLAHTDIDAILADTGTDGVVIAAGAIDAAAIATGAIDADAIAADAIAAAAIAADAITNAKIADNAFASEQFALSAGEKTTEGIVVTRATAALPQSTAGDLFTVTGLCLLKRIVGYVTVQVGAFANATKLKANSTGAGATTDICATVELNAAVADTRLEITGTFANAMVATIDVPLAKVQVTDVVIPPGSIMLDCAGSDGGGGRVRWSVTYVPMESGAQIVAA